MAELFEAHRQFIPQVQADGRPMTSAAAFETLLSVDRQLPRRSASPPSADSAAAAALDVLQNFISLKAINRQGSPMMAGPIAFTLAEAIDKQLANAVSAH
jgi:hypothetical protein